MKKMILAAWVAWAGAAFAAEHEIRMLDMSEDGKEPMVFDPPFLQVAPGDTVTFIPTHKSHWAESRLVPEGAEPFKGELDQRFSVTLDKEGIYLYVCPPHQMMNMVGMIQVGKAFNLAEAVEMMKKLERRAMSNKGRWETYAESIDLSGIPEIAEIMVRGDTLPKAETPKGK